MSTKPKQWQVITLLEDTETPLTVPAPNDILDNPMISDQDAANLLWPQLVSSVRFTRQVRKRAEEDPKTPTHRSINRKG